jgi:hypothetical protein
MGSFGMILGVPLENLYQSFCPVWDSFSLGKFYSVYLAGKFFRLAVTGTDNGSQKITKRINGCKNLFRDRNVK